MTIDGVCMREDDEEEDVELLASSASPNAKRQDCDRVFLELEEERESEGGS